MRTLRLRLPVLLAGLAALLAAGCFDIEESIDLDRNLSGKAGFSATVDMGGMVLPMLMMQRQMAGKTGDPTPEEIAAARKEMIAQQKTSPQPSKTPNREEIEKSLPPGVRLLDIGTEDKMDLKLKMHALFGFDDLNKLAQIQDPKKAGEAPEPGKPMLFDRPFAGLKLKDEGRTVLVSTELGNPVAEADAKSGAAAKPSPEDQKKMEQLFQGLHLRFRLTTPFDVVDTNATRRDGRTLLWDYDLAAIQKLAESQQPVKVWARLRR